MKFTRAKYLNLNSFCLCLIESFSKHSNCNHASSSLYSSHLTTKTNRFILFIYLAAALFNADFFFNFPMKKRVVLQTKLSVSPFIDFKMIQSFLNSRMASFFRSLDKKYYWWKCAWLKLVINLSPGQWRYINR